MNWPRTLVTLVMRGSKNNNALLMSSFLWDIEAAQTFFMMQNRIKGLSEIFCRKREFSPTLTVRTNANLIFLPLMLLYCSKT